MLYFLPFAKSTCHSFPYFLPRLLVVWRSSLIWIVLWLVYLSRSSSVQCWTDPDLKHSTQNVDIQLPLSKSLSWFKWGKKNIQFSSETDRCSRLSDFQLMPANNESRIYLLADFVSKQKTNISLHVAFRSREQLVLFVKVNILPHYLK